MRSGAFQKKTTVITMGKFAPAYSIKVIWSVSHGLLTVQKNGNFTHDIKKKRQNSHERWKTRNIVLRVV